MPQKISSGAAESAALVQDSLWKGRCQHSPLYLHLTHTQTFSKLSEYSAIVQFCFCHLALRYVASAREPHASDTKFSPVHPGPAPRVAQTFTFACSSLTGYILCWGKQPPRQEQPSSPSAMATGSFLIKTGGTTSGIEKGCASHARRWLPPSASPMWVPLSNNSYGGFGDRRLKVSYQPRLRPQILFPRGPKQCDHLSVWAEFKNKQTSSTGEV